MRTVTATTERRDDPSSDPVIFRYSVISSTFCTHHTVLIIRNEQNANCICHFDRI